MYDPITAGRFAVLPEPLDVNAIGRGIVAGVTPVKVTVDPDHLYDFAEMEPGNTLSLRYAPAGSARVLWLEESGSSTRREVAARGWEARGSTPGQYTQKDSNLQPSVPKTDALSS